MEVAAIIQVLLDKLVSLAVSIHAHPEGIYSRLKKIEKMLSDIRIVLADAEDKQMTKDPVKLWLEDLNDVVHGLDDLLDEVATETLPSQASTSSKVRKLIPTCCTCFTPPPSAVNLDHNLMSMVEENTARLQYIETQKNRLDLKQNAGGIGSSKVRQRPSLLKKSYVYGREEEKKAIINDLLLKNENSDDKVSVISIVGMAGIGKTSLAQLLYHDDCRLKGHFDLKAWVRVSDDFDVVRVSETILETVTSIAHDFEAYDMNDLLDELDTEALRLELIMSESQASTSTSKVRKLSPTCFTPPNAVKLDHNIMSKVEEIAARLQDIENRKNNLDLKENVGGTISYNFVADALIREFSFAAFGFILSVEDLYKSRMSYQNEPIVYIDPFRSKVSDLKAMEVQNLQFHCCMLGRISYQNETVQHNSLGDGIIKSRKWCWAQEFEDMGSDGCFTMELLRRPIARRSYKKMKGLLISEYNPNIHYLVYMSGMKSGGFTSPDSQHVVANDGDIDPEIGKMLGEAGALKARDLANDNDHDVVYDSRGGGCHKPSHNAINAIIKPKRECLYGVLLLMASLVAKITYQAAFSVLGGTLKERYAYNYAANGTLQVKKLDSIVTRSFILFNSTGFVASVAVIIFLLHEFPLKPWPQITVTTLFGSYMCLIMATSPREALALLFLASPFLLLAAAGKYHGFARKRSY